MNYQTNRPVSGKMEVIYTRTREYKKGDTMEKNGVIYRLWSVSPARFQFKNTFIEVPADEVVTGMPAQEE